MPTRKRNIACLESLWDEKIEDRLNVVPTLDFYSKLWKIKYSHLTCNTKEELKYNLRLLCKRNYGILYLGFHGSPGSIFLHDKTPIPFSELAEIMSDDFSGWIIHFGSCSTMRSPKQLADFVEQTGAALVTGYTKNVSWMESTAMELLLFEKFQSHESLKVAWRNVQRDYGELVARTGLQAYPFE